MLRLRRLQWLRRLQKVEGATAVATAARPTWSYLLERV